MSLTLKLAYDLSGPQTCEKQAERKGVPYQTYIRSLLHETLVERER
jgi:predicted DNA binding CopG/RHH family protein